MKKILSFVLVLFSFNLYSQSFSVPVNVLKSFGEKYPTATDTVWKVENNFYVVVFLHDNLIKNSKFDFTNNWVETIINYDKELQLPKLVVSAYKSKVKGSTVSMMTKTESSTKSPFYEITIETDDKTMVYKISDVGKIMEETQIKDE